MGNSKTYNYPKANRSKTSSQAGHSSRVQQRKPEPQATQNLEQEDTPKSNH